MKQLLKILICTSACALFIGCASQPKTAAMQRVLSEEKTLPRNYAALSKIKTDDCPIRFQFAWLDYLSSLNQDGLKSARAYAECRFIAVSEAPVSTGEK